MNRRVAIIVDIIIEGIRAFVAAIFFVMFMLIAWDFVRTTIDGLTKSSYLVIIEIPFWQVVFLFMFIIGFVVLISKIVVPKPIIKAKIIINRCLES